MTISETIEVNSYISECFDQIIKSCEDKRHYKGLVLRNGLKVLLISDVDTDKSAVALDVNIGHMSDPRDIQGLAHFLEHMLFLGTEKYPNENEYDSYISRNGGFSNASTSIEHTNFYFDISTDHLSEALDRFAQFFIKPLFTESATDREMNAVHSEHERKIADDGWRLLQLSKTLCDRSHDYNKFFKTFAIPLIVFEMMFEMILGNMETLKQIPLLNGTDVRQALLMFHERWYSANIMSLVVLGKESMENLLEILVPLFSQIVNTNRTVPEWKVHPCSDECLRKQTFVVPVKDIRNVCLSFPVPDKQSGAGNYIAHLLGHEGPGGLLSELKHRGWCTFLLCYYTTSAKGFGFFRLSVDLTEEGIESVDQIIAQCFQYINLLKKEGPQQWIYEERKRIKTIAFQYKAKERPIDYVKTLALDLHDYTMDEILSAGYLLREYRPEVITELLGQLTVDRVCVRVVAKRFASKVDMTEHWYGTQYTVNDIPVQTLDMWRNCGLNDKFVLPAINDFIPENMDLKARDVSADERPQMIRNSVLSRVWYLQDNRYLKPKAYYFFHLTNPIAFVDPFHENAAYLFARLFRDSVNECLYGAELAGLFYSLSIGSRGLTLEVGGYDDKLKHFLTIVLDKIIDFKIDEKRFPIIKEMYVRGLRNYTTRSMSDLARYYTTLITCRRYWSYEELLATASDMTVENVSQYIRRLLSRLHIEALIHGNIERTEALEVCDLVQNQLRTRLGTGTIALSEHHYTNRQTRLPGGRAYSFETTNAIHKTNAIQVYFQFGVEGTVSNVSLELLLQLLKEPFFNRLRTQEQLGYLTCASIRYANGVQGMSFIIESDCMPSYLNQRIEAFISWAQIYINDMSDDVFNEEKQSLITRKLEKTQTIRHLFHESSNRRKLLVTILGVDALNNNFKCKSTEDLFPAPDLKEPMKIEDMSQFRNRLGFCPLPKPMIDVYKLDES